MTMPPYQPSADTTLLNPIDPYGKPELGALVTALSAHLDNPTYRIELGGPLEVQGTAWATDDESAPATAAVRRDLYDVAEDAIAAVEAQGWTHAEPPRITITATERRTPLGDPPPRVGAHVLLTLHWPRPADTGEDRTR
ncbi:hypothetical protein ABT352_32980 [Streptosporangium sp. NPDC000563]|uniref:hypothetical protein n=1 Tax=Streptosporangium sp. NPDC000563 TaxID=3154366 RepID=UPI0033216304